MRNIITSLLRDDGVGDGEAQACNLTNISAHPDVTQGGNLILLTD